MATDPFDISWMLGRSVVEVRFSEPAQWLFSFETAVGIGAECPWRLLKQNRIVVSVEDHLQKCGLGAPIDAARKATEFLRGKVVTRTNVQEGTADLTLNFADDLRLEVIPFSSGYESWGLTTPTGFQIIAQGGGELCGFSAKA